jgi:hypothetical protein
VGEPITNGGPWVDELAHGREMGWDCCPLRLPGYFHTCGRYRHVCYPHRPDKILCIHIASAPPEGTVPTAEQRRLDEALARREAAGKGAEGD